MRPRFAFGFAVCVAACNALTGVGDLEVARCEGACEGDAAVSPERDGAPPDAGADAPSSTTDGSPPEDADAADASLPFCDSTDTRLVVCLPFEGSVTDLSSSPQVGTPMNVSYVAGRIGQAAQLSGTGSVVFPETSRLAVTVATIEAVVSPSAYSTTTRTVIADLDGRMSLSILSTGEIQCRSAATNTIVSSVPLSVFTHVACSVSATELVVYKNGVAVANQAAAGITLSSAGGLGVGVNLPSGEGFIGAIDEVRIWNVVRTPAEIAAAAARK